MEYHFRTHLALDEENRTLFSSLVFNRNSSQEQRVIPETQVIIQSSSFDPSVGVFLVISTIHFYIVISSYF